MTNFSLKAKLKPEVIRQIRNSKNLKAQLLVHFDISHSTLQLWLDKNSTNFTQYACLRMLMMQMDCKEVEELMEIHMKN
jgi:hypothetical protein